MNKLLITSFAITCIMVVTATALSLTVFAMGQPIDIWPTYRHKLPNIYIKYMGSNDLIF